MKSLMFVCKKNSRRSQMAEGFARTLGKGKIAVTSSGLVQHGRSKVPILWKNGENFDKSYSEHTEGTRTWHN